MRSFILEKVKSNSDLPYGKASSKITSCTSCFRKMWWSGKSGGNPWQPPVELLTVQKKSSEWSIPCNDLPWPTLRLQKGPWSIIYYPEFSIHCTNFKVTSNFGTLLYLTHGKTFFELYLGVLRFQNKIAIHAWQHFTEFFITSLIDFYLTLILSFLLVFTTTKHPQPAEVLQ